MSTQHVTREQAEAVLAEVKDRFREAGWFVNEANLRDHNHEGLSEGSWSIDWEGVSPEDWAIGYKTEVPGVHVEPILSFVLGIYPA